MGQNVQQTPVFSEVYTVTTASPVYLDTMALPFPINVSAIPGGGGGGLTIAYSTSPRAAGNPGSATWFNWPSGAVTAATNDVLLAPCTALRFTATTSTGVVEVVA